MAASLQLDAAIANFYIQEIYPYRVPEHLAIVDRAPELELRSGYMPFRTVPAWASS
jgi:galactonate dehydratase